MTGKEWSKLCKEHGVVVIDVNYKNMTHEDAIKFFDLLNTAMGHAFARKYDLETGQYEDYALPDGATYYEDDMNKENCLLRMWERNHIWSFLYIKNYFG